MWSTFLPARDGQVWKSLVSKVIFAKMINGCPERSSRDRGARSYQDWGCFWLDLSLPQMLEDLVYLVLDSRSDVVGTSLLDRSSASGMW
jgi:hypothetical protein